MGTLGLDFWNAKEVREKQAKARHGMEAESRIGRARWPLCPSSIPAVERVKPSKHPWRMHLKSCAFFSCSCENLAVVLAVV